jgi:hypothetical protein
MDLNRLKRFDKEKHDQLEGLLQWCQLMGLTGKDLVSLGGHIDRAQKTEDAKKNRTLAESIVFTPVGQNDMQMSNKWSTKNANGDRYVFESASWQRVSVTSAKTKVRKIFNLEYYELGRIGWQKRDRYQSALNLVNGKIVLNF